MDEKLHNYVAVMNNLKWDRPGACRVIQEYVLELRKEIRAKNFFNEEVDENTTDRIKELSDYLIDFLEKSEQK